MLIICSECGKEYSDQAKSCPHCGAITANNRYIYNGTGSNNVNRNNDKWIPYYKKENSIYKKYPLLAWSITIIAIVVGIWMMYSSSKEASSISAYNAGYDDAQRNYRNYSNYSK